MLEYLSEFFSIKEAEVVVFVYLSKHPLSGLAARLLTHKPYLLLPLGPGGFSSVKGTLGAPSLPSEGLGLSVLVADKMFSRISSWASVSDIAMNWYNLSREAIAVHWDLHC